VDIMPTDEKILQFSNRWYKEGFLQAQNYRLSEQVTIQILSVPYFIASKLEAFFSPYRKYTLDMYASHDFEDIIYILDHCEDVITLIKKSNLSVKTYIAKQFQHWLQQKSLLYALAGILRDEENEERLLNIIKKVAMKSV
jgi:predicted nucleotidyltransferase